MTCPRFYDDKNRKPSELPAPKAKREKGSPHSAPEKFENGVFILKMYEMFSVHATPEKYHLSF